MLPIPNIFQWIDQSLCYIYDIDQLSLTLKFFRQHRTSRKWCSLSSHTSKLTTVATCLYSSRTFSMHAYMHILLLVTYHDITLQYCRFVPALLEMSISLHRLLTCDGRPTVWLSLPSIGKFWFPPHISNDNTS